MELFFVLIFQTTENQQKRQSKRIPIVNPETNEEVKIEKVEKINQNSSGSNPHSAALKIEAPSPSQVPNQSQQQNQQVRLNFEKLWPKIWGTKKQRH